MRQAKTTIKKKYILMTFITQWEFFMRHILCGENGRNLINAAKNLWKILNFQNTWRFIVKPSVYHVCCLSSEDFFVSHTTSTISISMLFPILIMVSKMRPVYSCNIQINVQTMLRYSVWLAIKLYIWWGYANTKPIFIDAVKRGKCRIGCECARQK